MPHRRGFTLVELLVAVAIMLILAALLVPVYEQAVRKSEAAVCLSNVKSLVMAAVMYADDHDQRWPPALVPALPCGRATCWDRLILPYLRSPGLYLCPSHFAPTPGPSWTYSLTHSYGINLDVTLLGGYWGTSARTADVERPATTVLFFDLEQPDSYGWSQGLGNMGQYVDDRHNGGCTLGFCGGNARWLRSELTLQESPSMWAPY